MLFRERCYGHENARSASETSAIQALGKPPAPDCLERSHLGLFADILPSLQVVLVRAG